MNPKEYLDIVNTSEARVQQIAAQIEGHLEADEADKALALKTQLDEAKAEAKKANDLYLLSLNASELTKGKNLTPVGGNVQVVRDAADQPWEPGGEFFRAVKVAALKPAQTDVRLKSLKNTTGSGEDDPSSAGYLVIPQYSTKILERMYSTGDILSRVLQDPVTGNSMTYNAVDESSRANGSRNGGITSYWKGEGVAPTVSKPKFRQIELKLKKVIAMCYATDEQLEDAPSLESWLNRVVPDELTFQVEEAVMKGDGVGKPVGILSAPCLNTILRVDATEIDATDISNMWAHRWAGLKDYVWFIDQSVWPQLFGLTIGQVPIFLPAGSINGAPYDTLIGRPLFETEHNQALGTAGDILLASMSQYQTITKGGVKGATSLEVAFATDEAAYRWTYRIDGKPTWNTTLTTTSATTVSPFVVLGASA